MPFPSDHAAHRPQDHGCACILLAAGGSRRLGRPKQLLVYAGETLVHRSARLAVEAGFSPVFIVVGCEAAAVSKEVKALPVRIAPCDDWQAGMSASLRSGLDSLQSIDPVLKHTLVMVCDQLHLDAGSLQHLKTLSLQHPEKIVAASYAGVLGVPAIFPLSFFPALRAIRGDKGARTLLAEHEDEVERVAFSEGSLDIDTTEDARRAGLLK